MENTYEINDQTYRKVEIKNKEEYDYLYSAGLGTRIYSKTVAYVYVGHYELAKRLLFNKRNPINIRS